MDKQQAAFAGKSEADVRAAMNRGNSGAAAELLKRGDLKDEADFAKAKSLIPRNSEAGNKLDEAHKTKMPVSGVTGVTSQTIKSELAGAGGLSAATRAKISASSTDTRKYASKMDDKDIGKNEDQIRALLQTAKQQVNTGKSENELAIGLTPDKIRAYSQHLSKEGQVDLEKLIDAMHNPPPGAGAGNSLLSTAQKAAAKKAGYNIP
jgi:hypothetical protein